MNGADFVPHCSDWSLLPRGFPLGHGHPRFSNFNSTTKLRLYADDTILYNSISSVQDAENLQKDLNALVTWATAWQLSFNLKKCNVLRVSRSNSPITFNYAVQGLSIPSVSQRPYLGIELTSNLSWNRHIQIITKKANQTLAFFEKEPRKLSTNSQGEGL